MKRITIRKLIIVKFFITILFTLGMFPIGLSQSLDEEATTGILRGLLGDLPSACSDITNSVCIYCLGYVKFLPLAFFFGLFYLMLTFGIILFTKGESNVPSIKFGILLISIALTLYMFQSGAIGSALSRIGEFSNWVGGLIILIFVGVISLFGNRIINAVKHTPDVGDNPMIMAALILLTFIVLGILIGFTASFAGGLSPWFLGFLAAILFVRFIYAFLTGYARTLFGIILLVLFFLLLGVITGGIGEGFKPELFQENPDFDLGICA